MTYLHRSMMVAVLLLTSACSVIENGHRGRTREITDKNLLSEPEAYGLKKRIMVLPFLSLKPEMPMEIQSKARQVFILNLNKTRDLLAMDSEDLKLPLDKYLKDNAFQMEELSKEADKLGIPTLLEGKVVDVKIKTRGDMVGIVRNIIREYEVQIQVRMIQTRTGKEIYNTQKNLLLEDKDYKVFERITEDQKSNYNWNFIGILVKDAFLEFIPQIQKAAGVVSWQGRIAAVQGERVFINVGQISGVKIGDLLKVSDTSEDIYDPETGTHLGQVPGRLKGTLEVISYFGQDGAVAVIHSGSGFKEADRVELY